jgi:hypothetical protein
VKYQLYIENVILNNPTLKEKEQFQIELYNNPELKKEYDTYIETLEFLQVFEINISAETTDLQDFEFDPKIALAVEKYFIDYKHSRTTSQLSNIIREILNSNNHDTTVKFHRGWFKSAAFIVLVLTPVALCIICKQIRQPVIIKVIDPESNFNVSFKGKCKYRLYSQQITTSLVADDKNMIQ